MGAAGIGTPNCSCEMSGCPAEIGIWGDCIAKRGRSCSFKRFSRMSAMLITDDHDLAVSRKYWMHNSALKTEFEKEACAKRPEVAWTAERTKIVPAEKTT